MTTPAHQGVHAHGVRKSFHSAGRPHEVLKGIDLDLLPGEVVGLIGPNGAGKTTLMSCLLGFLRPEEGGITFDGLPNRDLTIRRRTGFVPERMNLGRRSTGRQFLRYMARISGVPRAEIDGRAANMLERLGLTSARNASLREYSRGMLQRIAIAQALLHKPDFIFLDEPASALDPNGVILVRDLINEEKQRGAMVLLNSHQLAEVEKVCDRVLFLHGGLVARAETLRNADRCVMAIRLLTGSFDVAAVERIAGATPIGDIVIISSDTERGVALIVRQLITSGADIVEIRPQTADLESIFRGAS
jgi:ABC-2 type transport system ATP-binding protein